LSIVDLAMSNAGNSQTIVGKEEGKKLNTIVQSLLDNNDSFEFRQPVDVEGLGLNDYLDIVKTPMDLGTVKKNLKANKYKFVEDCLTDIFMVWDNCKIYNAQGSWIWKLADKLEKLTKKLAKTHCPNITMKKLKEGGRDSGDEDEENITYQEKIKLTQKVKGLTQEQLGNIVKIIQEECPSAWKEVEKDKYQILVDNLKKETFIKIEEYIDSCLQEVTDQPIKKLKT